MRTDQVPTPRDTPRKVVVLAEADDEVREYLARELRSDGYLVIALADGLELRDYLELAELSHYPVPSPDLILSDVGGLQICRMHSRVEGSAPFILLAPRDDADSWENAEEAGAAHVLNKPVNLAELHDAVACYLEAR